MTEQLSLHTKPTATSSNASDPGAIQGEVAIIEPTKSLDVGAITPADMIRIAVENKADISIVKELMDMKERWEASDARRAFNEAFTKFKADAVQVVKKTTVKDGPLSGKKYAELFSVVDSITPALTKQNLSASWAVTKDEKDWIEVTCTVRHLLGHSERVSMGGPPDAGGAKNAIQARASTVNYLQRYTLLAITGLAAKGEDQDGNQTSGLITEVQQAEIVALIEETGADVPKLCSYFKVGSITEIPAKMFLPVKNRLLEKKNKAPKKGPAA